MITIARRFRAVALVATSAALLSGLVGCTSPAASVTNPGGEAALSGKTIAYIQTYSNPYYDATAAGVMAAAKSLGANTLVLQSNFDPATERANVQDAITKQVAAVVLEPATAEGTGSLLDLLNEAKIPTVVLYGYSDKNRANAAGFVQANYTDTGKAAGEALKAALPQGHIGVITGALGRGDAEAMLAGFKDGLGGDSRVVSVVDGKWDRQQAFSGAQDIITKNPDLAGLFVMNEPMAAGAIQALGDKIHGVTVVSQNGSPEGVDLIKAGTLQATVAWSPVVEGVFAVRILRDTLAGKPLAEASKLCLVPFKSLTKGNIGDTPSWKATDAFVAEAFKLDCATS